ncbi:hypothetical protein DFH08DRAFT_824443 [Mycena albidolilacea]|uniref:Uncharacterized protein n=1 Tax=Mycena albidolilacea TaxID=1033008 RepID=A0AAD6Z4J8_9AGAR|nr:hypothetical protein DFH08DRAFT_824443 [Mycena albidolilacea]
MTMGGWGVESVTPSKSLSNNLVVMSSRCSSSPTKIWPGAMVSSGGTHYLSKDAKSEGKPVNNTSGPTIPAVAPHTEGTLEEGLGWNPDHMLELSQEIRQRWAMPTGASKGVMPDCTFTERVESRQWEKRLARRQMWSITPAPKNSQGVGVLIDATEPPIVGEEYQHMLSSYIIQHTQKVTIGPLEYCGNTHHISMGKSTIIFGLVGLCWAKYDCQVSGAVLGSGPNDSYKDS